MLTLPLSSTLFPEKIGDVPAHASWLERLGYRGLWVGEGRLRRDAVTAMTLAAHATSTAYIASGIVPFRTRNVTLLAITWKTLYQLAPGRVRLGLGTWWEPIASRAGLPTAHPLTAMREVFAVLREMFAGRHASLAGDYVQVHDVAFDGAEDEGGAAYPVRLYMAAVGPRMLRLAGELADGVLLDFFTPPAYTRRAVRQLHTGLRHRTLTEDPDRPQLVACCIDDEDPMAAAYEARVTLTRYIAQQSHVARYCGADPELVAAVRRRITWPTNTTELREAAKLVPLSLVRSVAAVGSTSSVVDRLSEYVDAGSTEIVVAPFGAGRDRTVELIAARTRTRRG